ncbi:MAG: hypothetical protein HYT87_08720 [Nitrospirae bacterium]|nr:hypothetical protein [Nitrospirota bacterium]
MKTFPVHFWAFTAASLSMGTCGTESTPATPVVEYIAQDADFDCMLNWDRVGKFRIINRLGMQAEALAVARGDKKGPFPVGTIIQLVPVEAMVKRGRGFAPEANDWEFFFLDPKIDTEGNPVGKTIQTRGARETINRFGGNCFDCHVKAQSFDFICGTDHGCDPIPLAEAPLIDGFQTADPSCPH